VCLIIAHQTSVSGEDHDGGVPSITVRTPHAPALANALAARDLDFEMLEPDVIRVHGMAPDDLGWLAAAAGVVVYEMVTHR
jgi:hypothetical protein